MFDKEFIIHSLSALINGEPRNLKRSMLM